jgi:DNA repair protein RecN (Recombination protein N)
MLRDLVVENLGVIERADLELSEGSCALTGETGAGKTLLVSAMGLLLGDRSDRSLIRHGAREARVEARFDLCAGHPALEVLIDKDLVEPNERELVVSRAIAEGGGKVRINGRLAPVATLAEIGPSLVEIAGQHEHQRLGSRRQQLALLDDFAGERAQDLAGRVANAVTTAARARTEADRLESGERERARDLDRLQREIAEIEGAALREGESDELKVEAARLEHAAAISSAIADARSSLEREGGAVDEIRAAASSLDHVVERDPNLVLLLQRLESATLDLDDVAQELRDCVPNAEPGALEDLRSRLAMLKTLHRKFGADDAAVLSYLREAKATAGRLEDATLDIERARREAQEREAEAEALAGELSTIRAHAAVGLQREVEAILETLAMGSTSIEVTIEPRALYEGGLETVELRAANPGQVPRPISKVASGGELSRISLALRLASASSSAFASTMIFDEVDAGVGGEAARSVGRALADLAQRTGVQVLVVTHLPQVAAFADSHLKIKKTVTSDTTSASVERLDEDGRVAELSRMLAGLPDSDRAREHAQELLEMASGR